MFFVGRWVVDVGRNLEYEIVEGGIRRLVKEFGFY